MHYGKIKEFVSVMMDVYPDVLSESQRKEVTLGLQHISSAKICCKIDPAVKGLMWEFLSGLDQLLSVPDLNQTVSWLSAAPSVIEECMLSASYIDQLKAHLRQHKSVEQLDMNATLPSVGKGKLSSLSFPPSQRVVDSKKLTNTQVQSESVCDYRQCLSPSASIQNSSGKSAMDNVDFARVEPRLNLSNCEGVVERTERETEYLNKEEEDWQRKSTQVEREDDVRDENRIWKEEEIEQDNQWEGCISDQVSQTDKFLENGLKSEFRYQEGEGLSTCVTSCSPKQPRVLICRLETENISFPTSSRPHYLSCKRDQGTRYPLRLNELDGKKGEIVTWKGKTICQFENPMKLEQSLSENRSYTKAALISSVKPSRNRNTGRTFEASPQVFSQSLCPSVHTEEVKHQKHIDLVYPEKCSRTESSEQLPSSTHEHPAPPHTLSNQTQTNICSQCGKSFQAISPLRKHEKMHEKERPYHCCDCGMSFTLLTNLQRHQQTHTSKLLHPSHQFATSFTQLGDLKKHQRIHSGARSYQCSHCGKSFSHPSSLKVHVRNHTGERPYHCSQCSKTFTKLAYLKIHLRTHTGERPYQCTHCGNSFTQHNNLKQHLQTHTGERPYQCSQCSKNFGHLNTLKRHQVTHMLNANVHMPD
ncbi:hypothetical protein GJAV_G00115060 [Gymnothorax javanicus]|nr:hypothetical protein GJAV_G00115060 [Gymnothorax javanicus]